MEIYIRGEDTGTNFIQLRITGSNIPIPKKGEILSIECVQYTVTDIRYDIVFHQTTLNPICKSIYISVKLFPNVSTR